MALLNQCLSANQLAELTFEQRDFIIGRMDNTIREILSDKRTEANQKIIATINESFEALGKGRALKG